MQDVLLLLYNSKKKKNLQNLQPISMKLVFMFAVKLSNNKIYFKLLEGQKPIS